MADTNKYGKYFIGPPEPGEVRTGYAGLPHTILFTDDDIIKGSKCFWALQMSPDDLPAPHGPHVHEAAEFLVMLGTDPKNPWDLGAEIDLYMGEEQEVHTITKSTLVFVPGNMVHCPLVYKRVDRPFIFINCQFAPKLTEKSLKKLVKEKEVNKMLFFDFDGEQSDQEVEKQIKTNEDRTGY